MTTGAPDKNTQTLLQHLTDLRSTLLACVMMYAVCVVVCYALAPHIYQILLWPLEQLGDAAPQRLIYTGLAEAFVTYLNLSLWAGLILAMPLMATQAWRFIAPGLYAHEKKVAVVFMLLTPLLFGAGVAFAYFFAMPVAWSFFLSFQNMAGSMPIQAEPRVAEYLSLSMTFIFAFGLAFLLPLLLLLLVQAGVLSIAQLQQYRRYAIVANFAVAAIITPPDALSQIMLAVPLCLLYEAAIVGGKLIKPRARPHGVSAVSQGDD